MLSIIDAVGPFFRGYEKDIINWSKVPFDNLEKDGRFNWEKFKLIKSDFIKFIKRVKKIGYNSVALDELSRMVEFRFYPERLKSRLNDYSKAYEILIELCRKEGLKVFVTTDIMFFNEKIKKRCTNDKEILNFLNEALRKLFTQYNIDGVIFRIGESDGLDVKGDFLSELVIKTPGQLNRYIENMLPLFEQFDKLMIIRNWTMGAYKIGDLMWNKHTFRRAFGDIQSDNFIISMKYGESDFFRELELNKLFFETGQKKIIELQGRREYECFGSLPFYVGWDYEKYYQKLKDEPSFAGINVFCQSKGWGPWKDITFLQNSSEWNELNTIASLKVFEGKDPGKVIKDYSKDLTDFLKHYNYVSRKILYFDSRFYFGKIRVPPLFWVFWNYVTVNSLSRAVAKATRMGEPEINKKEIDNVYELGKRAGIDIHYIYDTLMMLYYGRRSLVTNENIDDNINEYKRKYKKFKFFIDYGQKPFLEFFLKIMLRRKKGYRIIDRLVFFSPLKILIGNIIMVYQKSMPGFANVQGMDVKSIFK